jgi:hypothetical protein
MRIFLNMRGWSPGCVRRTAPKIGAATFEGKGGRTRRSDA